MEDDALRQIFSIGSAAWTATAIFAVFVIRLWNGGPAMFGQWIEYRKSIHAEKSSDWTRLREEIDRLSKSEKQCREDFAALHSQHMDLSRRIAELEGYQIGQGRASQEAAGVIALERLKKDGGSK